MAAGIGGGDSGGFILDRNQDHMLRVKSKGVNREAKEWAIPTEAYNS
jgi:hypothetical protein